MKNVLHSFRVQNQDLPCRDSNEEKKKIHKYIVFD